MNEVSTWPRTGPVFFRPEMGLGWLPYLVAAFIFSSLISYLLLLFRFNDLVSSAHVLQANRAYKENDVALIRSKINIILKLYLHSEIPPRLRVKGIPIPLWAFAKKHFFLKNSESQ